MTSEKRYTAGKRATAVDVAKAVGRMTENGQYIFLKDLSNWFGIPGWGSWVPKKHHYYYLMVGFKPIFSIAKERATVGQNSRFWKPCLYYLSDSYIAYESFEPADAHWRGLGTRNFSSMNCCSPFEQVSSSAFDAEQGLLPVLAEYISCIALSNMMENLRISTLE
jgi:hypothetical protein